MVRVADHRVNPASRAERRRAPVDPLDDLTWRERRLAVEASRFGALGEGGAVVVGELVRPNEVHTTSLPLHARSARRIVSA